MKKYLMSIVVVMLLLALPCVFTESSFVGDHKETASAHATAAVVTDSVFQEKEAADKSDSGIPADAESGDAVKTQLVVAYSDDSLTQDEHFVSSTNDYYLLEYATAEEAAADRARFAADDKATAVENPIVMRLAETSPSSFSDTFSTLENDTSFIADPISGTGQSITATYLSYGPETIDADTFQADLLTKYTAVNNMPDVVIGVVDTGIDTDHAFLSDRILKSSDNFITSTGNAEDDNGHGTHVAGIIVDTTFGNVKLKAYKAADSSGNGTDYSVAAGINAAAADGVDIINVSMSGLGTSAVLNQAVANATAAGILICVASGNANIDADACVPASCPGAFTVAAVNSSLERATFSNYGDCVDIAAPGVNINSSYVGGFYTLLTGTSMATPFVSAAGALLLSYDDTAGLSQIKHLISSYAVDCGTVGWDEYYGYGVLDLSDIESGNCIISFDANGGSNVNDVLTVPAGSTCPTLPTTTLKGNTFVGWYSSDGALLRAGDIVGDVGRLTLKARWALTTYKVTLDANGGSCSPTSLTVSCGSTYADLPTPTWLGHTFTGWFNKAGKQISQNTVVDLSCDTTLTARWTTNTYKVTFDPGGGTVSPATITVTYGEPYGTLPIPTMAGNTFTGWYTPSSLKIQPSSTVTLTSDITLKAQWEYAKFTIYFDANGGNCTTPSKTVVYSSTYGPLPTPTRAGYAFIGWYSASGELVSSSSPVQVTGDATVYAHWVTSGYTVYFDAGGGSCSPSSKTVDYNSAYGTLPTPTRTGYTFAGWYTSTGMRVTSTSIVANAADITLTAKWNILYYSINVVNGENGSISPSGSSLSYGSSQTFTITPNSGYVVENVKVDGSNLGAVTSYTFANIASNHTISATFVWNNPYGDVSSSAWYYNSVRKVTQWGLFTGTSSSLFSPDAAMTRAMFVSVLYRYEGSPAVSGSTPFTDLTQGYYYNAVLWASQNGIVTGTSATAFSPDASVTRQQMVVFLYRYCGNYKGYNVSAAASLSGYSDANQVSSYALDAMKWAVAKGYISGTSTTSLSPQAVATRAQVSEIFVKFIESL
ncbi:MAG TPA: InlB B-repeat-containing protein [Clostridiales bacterium]|nr:InlB B-repeat-containing protein [Clostridiales bacterium]